LIYALIKKDGNTLAMDIPYEPSQIHDRLTSIGIVLTSDKIPIGGTEDMEVILKSEDEMGKAFIEKVDKGESLKDFNLLCRQVHDACCFGQYDMPQRIKDFSHTDIKSLSDLVEKIEGEWFQCDEESMEMKNQWK